MVDSLVSHPASDHILSINRIHFFCISFTFIHIYSHIASNQILQFRKQTMKKHFTFKMLWFSLGYNLCFGWIPPQLIERNFDTLPILLIMYYQYIFCQNILPQYSKCSNISIFSTLAVINVSQFTSSYHAIQLQCVTYSDSGIDEFSVTVQL